MDNPCRYCIIAHPNHNGTQRYPGCQSHCEHGITYKEWAEEERKANLMETMSYPYVDDRTFSKRMEAIQSAKDNKKRAKKCVR